MAFTLEGFEVYNSEYDDRGVDFVVRNNSSNFFLVQVKATDNTVNPFIRESKFDAGRDFLFCAVRMVEERPLTLYLARGSDWFAEYDCLHINADGGALGPYYEMRFASKYNNELTQFEFANYVERIRT